MSPNNLASNGKFLIATNAASNSLSVFRVGNDGLTLVDIEPSNGEHPVSVTVSDGVVLNNGDAAFAPPPNCSVGPGIPNITGFTLTRRGNLEPIAGSTRLLSGDRDSGCAQVSCTPDGQFLVVTERTAGSF